MTASRWRGTLIYTGTIAAMGTVAVARFGPLLPTATEQAAAVTTGTSGATGTSGTSDGTASTGSSSGTVSPADTSGTSTGTATTTDTVTVTGSVAQTRYGPVQVAVTFTGSEIVSVQTLQSPDSHRESQQINARATPVLAQEVVTAQSAQIDTVSGATYTSAGYRESVQSAIDQRG